MIDKTELKLSLLEKNHEFICEAGANAVFAKKNEKFCIGCSHDNNDNKKIKNKDR